MNEFVLRLPGMRYKRRRTLLVLFLALGLAFITTQQDILSPSTQIQNSQNQQIKNTLTSPPANSTNALEALEHLPVKGRAPKTEYERKAFMNDWRQENNCDKRNIILKRDLNNTVIAEDGCLVLSGDLHDPYTGTNINFVRGFGSSSKVQIDHIVSLSDAWQKGAQLLSYTKRNNFANDSLNLLAVDGPANIQKSGGDAATWLPPNKIYRCPFVARQIAVKSKYDLWVTQAEKEAIKRILNNCPDQVLPVENG